MRTKTTGGHWPIRDLVLVLLLLGVSGPPAAGADPARTRQEIDHLMGYIAAAQCRFIRNGKAYDAQTAREHIQRKDDHLHSRIRTAEDFIRYAASRSSMSGEPYRIACGNQMVRCADWLHEELVRFRRQTGGAD